MRLYQIDAFTDRLFGGNPAAVIPLTHWLADAQMQQIAAENNLSETAFVVKQDNGWHIRWFTPTVEVDLCGHATLASAWVLFNELGVPGDRIDFQSVSGPLPVYRQGDWLTLDFPARPPALVQHTAAITDALNALGIAAPLYLGAARDLLVLLPDEAAVLALRPDFAQLAQCRDYFAVAVTAPGNDDTDFVCRFFAPSQGIPEDPVTGSAFCTLAPFWAQRLGHSSLTARQVSARGGVVRCALATDQQGGNRVHISGRAVCYLRGEINS